MPEFLAPGVIVEEVSFAGRPIAGVSTSTTAFFGSAPSATARLRAPTLTSSWLEFQRRYVDGDGKQGATALANAAHGFFLNGGKRLYVVNLGAEMTSLGPRDVALIEAIDDISLIAAPGFTDAASYEALIADCEQRGDRFAVLDVAERARMTHLLTPPMQGGGLRPRTTGQGVAAVYAPWVSVADALDGRRINIPPSGHVCGLYALTDAMRGVHKAPANAPLRGVLDLGWRISSREQSLLNPLGINVIRHVESGIRVWGARTLAGPASEYRYVPVRRLITMISSSIVRGTQWAALEPNDDALWKKLRRDIGRFLQLQWRDGALTGASPAQAFFVQCDASTMSQADIDAGRVIALVGVAPLKPAEFVVIRFVLTRD